MKKKVVIPILVFIILLLAGVGILTYYLFEQKEQNKEMQALAY